jgi:hypothetical protein
MSISRNSTSMPSPTNNFAASILKVSMTSISMKLLVAHLIHNLSLPISPIHQRFANLNSTNRNSYPSRNTCNQASASISLEFKLFPKRPRQSKIGKITKNFLLNLQVFKENTRIYKRPTNKLYKKRVNCSKISKITKNHSLNSQAFKEITSIYKLPTNKLHKKKVNQSTIGRIMRNWLLRSQAFKEITKIYKKPTNKLLKKKFNCSKLGKITRKHLLSSQASREITKIFKKLTNKLHKKKSKCIIFIPQP